MVTCLPTIARYHDGLGSWSSRPPRLHIAQPAHLTGPFAVLHLHARELARPMSAPASIARHSAPLLRLLFYWSLSAAATSSWPPYLPTFAPHAWHLTSHDTTTRALAT